MLLLACNSFNKSRDIIVNGDVDGELLDRLTELNLVHVNDVIFGLWFSKTEEVGSKYETYTFFTTKELVRFYHFEGNDAKTIRIPLNKVLNISKTIDPIDTSRILIKVKQLDKVLYNNREQENDLFDSDFDFRPPYDTDINEQEEYYQLLLDKWKSNKSYEELREVYAEFYNIDGTEVISKGTQLEREKLKELSTELTNLKYNLIISEDFVIMYKDHDMFFFSYDFVNEEYTVFKIVTDNEIEEDEDALFVPKLDHYCSGYNYF